MPLCSFEIDYLGHIISGNGVRVDQSKLQSMLDWAIQESMKAFRGFLGLTGYYRKFICGYGSIDAPLTLLWRKNSFQWSNEVVEAFMALKKAVSQPPMLRLLDFSKEFTTKCDVFGMGLGAILMQD